MKKLAFLLLVMTSGARPAFAQEADVLTGRVSI